MSRVLHEMQSCEAFLRHMVASMHRSDVANDTPTLAEQLCERGRETIRSLVLAVEQEMI